MAAGCQKCKYRLPQLQAIIDDLKQQHSHRFLAGPSVQGPAGGTTKGWLQQSLALPSTLQQALTLVPPAVAKMCWCRGWDRLKAMQYSGAQPFSGKFFSRTLHRSQEFSWPSENGRECQ